MDQKTDRLYPSAPLENNDLEQRLKKKLDEVNSLNNSINNIKEMITYFKEKKGQAKKRYTKYKKITTILKSIDTIVFITTTSRSITLSLTIIGLIVVPISIGIAHGLMISNKVIYEIDMQKYNNDRKQNPKDQQTIESSDKI